MIHEPFDCELLKLNWKPYGQTRPLILEIVTRCSSREKPLPKIHINLMFNMKILHVLLDVGLGLLKR